MFIDVYIDSTAVVAKDAVIGAKTKIWINSQIREGVVIGSNCVISKDVYVDKGVVIGDRCKVQNGVSIYNGVTLEDDVFVGPHVAFTNDLYPRAFSATWEVIPTLLRRGASVGANATVVCGVEIGEFALVAAGSVVTKDVAPYTLVQGNPARPVGFVDRSGRPVAGLGRTRDLARSRSRGELGYFVASQL
jgi:UDP-2-acetamido-3-amino-2,3-dideoxy-glucuronate N-acetyltransferase